MDSSQFELMGVARVENAVPKSECVRIAALIQAHSGGAGTRRLLEQAWCADLARGLVNDPRFSPFMDRDFVPVQCTYFEKSASRNWLVAVHQDLSVPVAERIDHPDLRGWSEKEGSLFVQPPIELMERMVALRLHLDDCTEADGPLKVIPGTHLKGAIPPLAAVEARMKLASVSCVGSSGSVIAMRPLLLHASSKSTGASRRRVLHFLFAPPSPPYGLRWPG